MKKFKVLTMSTILTITSLGLLSTENAEASVLDESIVNVPVLESPILDESVLETPILDESVLRSVSGSGWKTIGGIKARVSTTKDTYESKDNIVVKAERSGTGATVYYRIDIYKNVGSSWVKTPDSGKSGNFTSKEHTITLNNYGTGLYQALLKVWSDSNEINWIGDWETNFYVK
ncbi:hypothetical protein [Lysinibacillus sphaericus]|uniref:hypothetical protein n=1 Tax=Lysinibacillus sphaericus TaxID=1421 RepID=UPI000C19335A|nr:hypothetical protein [Lysinibacillus sphaericus]PIJ96858.1 hypothetical protein CTN02_15715 [Lysinibacillus sphaericus]